ncbi:MAG: Cof-type HAD-IIB family hydrolase [Actinomycetota bacterium]|nr:Cof-type HAD-IIB family hydrolase [Actinomycetota bacterium]
MSIRLVATDIDGTLLNSQHHVSPRTRAALEAAEAAGLVVAFVTGRPPRWLDDLIEETGHLGVAVGANGAVLYDLSDETVISAHTIEPPLMLELADQLRSEFPNSTFAVEFGLGFAAEPAYVHDWEINPRFDRRGVAIAPPAVGPLVQIATAPAVKLLVKDRGVDPDLFLAAAVEVIGDRATITHSSSFGLLELSAPGVTKATGLAELAERHGIAPHEIAAIGDMPNDIPMLLWAGRSYAVANAHPAVREAAGEVTLSNDEDAVAVLIEGLLTDSR